MKAEAKSARVGPRNVQNFVYDFLSSPLSCPERIIVPLVVYFRMMVLAVPQFDGYQFGSKSGQAIWVQVASSTIVTALSLPRRSIPAPCKETE
jgi:hypothetical protein